MPAQQLASSDNFWTPEFVYEQREDGGVLMWQLHCRTPPAFHKQVYLLVLPNF